MQIFAVGASAKTTTLDLQEDNTVLDIKTQIQLKTGCPVSELRLLYGWKQLYDEETIFENHITAGSTIRVMLSLKGGATPLERAANHEGMIDEVWVLIASAMIFLMQAGFSLLEVGSVRPKSSSNILIKNMFDACIGWFGWYFLGYGFAYGEDDTDGFIGGKNFAQGDLNSEDERSAYYQAWVFQFTFCATAATIVSGSLAERTQLECYLIYSGFMSSFVYPVVAHWVWHPEGWLANHETKPYIDFAGSGAVHLVGGASGFIGAWILGPRYDLFKTGSNPLKQRSGEEEEDRPRSHTIDHSDDKVTIITNAIVDALDTDLSGTVEREELLRAMQEMAKDAEFKITAEEQLDEIWDQLDLDQKGYLSYDEFRNLIRAILQLKIIHAAHEQGASWADEDSIVPDGLNLICNSALFSVEHFQKIVEDAKGSKNKYRPLLAMQSQYAAVNQNEVSILADILKTDKPREQPNSIPAVVNGTMLLWVCWLFFNAGSTAKMAQLDGAYPSLVMMNTILGAGSGGFFAFFLKHRIAGSFNDKNKYDVGALCNGTLIGLVSITAGCNNIDPWAAILIGASGAVIYGLASRLLIKLKVDDPLEATHVHGFGGLWGVFVVGLFDKDNGIFYGHNWDQLGVQISAILAITGWSIFWSGSYFTICKTMGRFRVPLIHEVVGLDFVEHGRSIASRPQSMQEPQARGKTNAAFQQTHFDTVVTFKHVAYNIWKAFMRMWIQLFGAVDQNAGRSQHIENQISRNFLFVVLKVIAYIQLLSLAFIDDEKTTSFIRVILQGFRVDLQSLKFTGTLLLLIGPILFGFLFYGVNIYFNYKHMKLHWSLSMVTDIMHKIITYCFFVPITCATFGVLQANLFGNSPIYANYTSEIANPAYIIILPIFALIVLTMYLRAVWYTRVFVTYEKINARANGDNLVKYKVYIFAIVFLACFKDVMGSGYYVICFIVSLYPVYISIKYYTYFTMTANEIDSAWFVFLAMAFILNFISIQIGEPDICPLILFVLLPLIVIMVRDLLQRRKRYYSEQSELPIKTFVSYQEVSYIAFEIIHKIVELQKEIKQVEHTRILRRSREIIIEQKLQLVMKLFNNATDQFGFQIPMIFIWESLFYFIIQHDPENAMLKLQKAKEADNTLDSSLHVYHLTKLYKKHSSTNADIIDYVQVNTKSMKMDQYLTETFIKFWNELLNDTPNQNQIDKLVKIIVRTSTEYESLCLRILKEHPGYTTTIDIFASYLEDIKFDSSHDGSQLRQRLARAKIQQSQADERLNAQFERRMILIAEMGGKDMENITYCNPISQNILGFSPIFIIGKKINELIPKPFSLVHNQIIYDFWIYGSSSKPNLNTQGLYFVRSDKFWVKVNLELNWVIHDQRSRMYAMVDEIPDNGEMCFDVDNGMIYGSTETFSEKVLGHSALLDEGEVTALFPDIMDYTQTYGEQFFDIENKKDVINFSITTYQFKTYRLAMVKIVVDETKLTENLSGADRITRLTKKYLSNRQPTLDKTPTSYKSVKWDRTSSLKKSGRKRMVSQKSDMQSSASSFTQEENLSLSMMHELALKKFAMRVKVLMFLLILLICATATISINILITFTSEAASSDITHDLSQMRETVIGVAHRVRELQFGRHNDLSIQNLHDYIELLDDSVNSLKDQEYRWGQIKTMDKLLTEKEVTVWEYESGKYTEYDISLFDSIDKLIFYTGAILNQQDSNNPDQNVTATDRDFFYVYRNAVGGIVQSLNYTLFVYTDQIDVSLEETNALVIEITAISYIFWLVFFWAAVLPQTWKLNKTYCQIWALILAQNPAKLLENRNRCEDRLQGIHAYELGDLAARQENQAHRDKARVKIEDYEVRMKMSHFKEIVLRLSVSMIILTIYYMLFWTVWEPKDIDMISQKFVTINQTGLSNALIRGMYFWHDEILLEDTEQGYAYVVPEGRYWPDPYSQLKNYTDQFKWFKKGWFLENSLLHIDFTDRNKDFIVEKFLDHPSNYSQSLQMLLWEYSDRLENSVTLHNVELDDTFIETLDKYKDVVDEVADELIDKVKKQANDLVVYTCIVILCLIIMYALYYYSYIGGLHRKFKGALKILQYIASNDTLGVRTRNQSAATNLSMDSSYTEMKDPKFI